MCNLHISVHRGELHSWQKQKTQQYILSNKYHAEVVRKLQKAKDTGLITT